MAQSYSITQVDIDNWFSLLKTRIRQILTGTTPGENLLGTMEFTLDTTKKIPAIYTRTEQLTLNKWRMTANSGILVVIDDAIQFKQEPIIGGTAISMEFGIELVQYNPRLTTSLAVLRLLNCDYFEIFKEPIITPFTNLPDGVAWERAKLKALVYARFATEQLV